MVKNLPAMQETQVQSLGQEGPLEKKAATYSRGRSRQRSLAGYSPWGRKTVKYILATKPQVPGSMVDILTKITSVPRSLEGSELPVLTN